MTVVADEQVLAGTAATISASFRDQDGDLAEPAGTVTVGVADEAGRSSQRTRKRPASKRASQRI